MERNKSFLSILRFTAIFLMLLPTIFSDAAAGEEIQGQVKFVFKLEYQSHGFDTAIDMRELPREKTFEKEPSFEGSDIYRGQLQTGTEEEDYTGFIRDKRAGKIYLDLNHNRDLTDDPDGILTSESRGQDQYFTNSSVDMQFGSVAVSFMVNITMYDFKPPVCYFTVRSGFKGTIELYGKQWQMGVADNMNGKLNRSDSLYLLPIGADFDLMTTTAQLSFPETIFLDGRSYNLSFEYKGGDSKPLLEVTFTETTRPMGQLNIEGKFIKYLAAAGDSLSSLAVFDSPEKTISIPVGNYHIRKIFLDGGAAGLFQAQTITSLNIKEGEITELKAGAPLNHSVNLSRTGNIFKLNYELLDTGGISYAALRIRPDVPPTVTVYKGNKIIASGKFEYG